MPTSEVLAGETMTDAFVVVEHAYDYDSCDLDVIGVWGSEASAIDGLMKVTRQKATSRWEVDSSGTNTEVSHVWRGGSQVFEIWKVPMRD